MKLNALLGNHRDVILSKMESQIKRSGHNEENLRHLKIEIFTMEGLGKLNFFFGTL